MKISRQRHQKLLYGGIIATPALLLTLFLLMVGNDIIALRNVDPTVIYQDLKTQISTKKLENFPLPEKLSSLDRSRKTIFFFGASTLLLSDGGVFPDYLEQIDSDIQAVNFGENGIDSLLVRERVREALKIARPDLMFVLLGDNDYNTAFHNSIIPTYFDRLGWLLRLPYLFESEPAEITHFASHDFYWYKRLHQPELFNFLQKIGLFNIDIQKYQPINSLITQYCTQNLGVILDMASAQQIPVVVMTPIENLRAEPFGDIKTTTTLYKRGLSSTDYGESIRLLKAAKDTELFTYDLRAKSDIIESIRSLNRKNVYVLDLEKVLEKREFAFGSEDFVDYVHYNDRTHLMVADILYDFLSHNHLIE